MEQGSNRRRSLWGLLGAAVAGAVGGTGRRVAEAGASAGQAFSLPRLAADQAKAGEAWREFLRVESLSLGVYALKKDAVDKQTPHQQDEIYYVSAGRAVLTVDGKDFPVESGSVVYVAAHASHRFHHITEDLTTLVFFAPAEQE